jgi:hypothetical protein
VHGRGLKATDNDGEHFIVQEFSLVSLEMDFERIAERQEINVWPPIIPMRCVALRRDLSFVGLIVVAFSK